jgi:hypothetical protein
MVDTDQIKHTLHELFQIITEDGLLPADKFEQAVQVDAAGVVNVSGSVLIKWETQLPAHLPIKFGHVTKNFNIALFPQENLINLVGSPHTVGGTFRVSAPNLTSLLGAPVSVTGACHFNCASLVSLAHLPQSCGRLSLMYTPHLHMLPLVDQDYVNWSYLNQYGGRPKGVIATSIIEAHRGQGKAGAIKAAAELIRAGYKENARW